MTACRKYPELKEHDPDGTRVRTIKVVLDVGDSLLPATSLTPVDPETGATLVGDTFAIDVISTGLVASTPDGDIWGINYRLLDGTTLDVLRGVRFRPWLASQPDRPAYDQTFTVLVRNT